MEGTINEEDVVADAEKVAEVVTDGQDAAVVATTIEEAESVPEPVEDKTMTYAEYMASKGKKEETSGREVTNEFQGKSAAAKKEEEDFLVMGGGKQKKTKSKKEVEKKTIDVGFRVVSHRFFCYIELDSFVLCGGHTLVFRLVRQYPII
jgi:ribonucleotide reductase alpha subunit